MRYRSIIAARGSLGIALGLAVLLWPTVGLGELVVLFGGYALLDGVVAAAWAVRASRRPLEGWPVLLESVVSVGLGLVALGYPFQSARFVGVVAIWALATGILENIAALRFVRSVPARGFLAAGGVWSVFLALLVASVPRAVTHDLVIEIGVYALGFGVLVFVAAFIRRAPRMRARTVSEVAAAKFVR